MTIKLTEINFNHRHKGRSLAVPVRPPHTKGGSKSFAEVLHEAEVSLEAGILDGPGCSSSLASALNSDGASASEPLVLSSSVHVPAGARTKASATKTVKRMRNSPSEASAKRQAERDQSSEAQQAKRAAEVLSRTLCGESERQ